MGQVPFYPPNVSGWNQNTAWLNTNSTRAYFRTTSYLLAKPPDPGEESRRRRSRPRARQLAATSWRLITHRRLEDYATAFFNKYKYSPTANTSSATTGSSASR